MSQKTSFRLFCPCSTALKKPLIQFTVYCYPFLSHSYLLSNYIHDIWSEPGLQNTFKLCFGYNVCHLFQATSCLSDNRWPFCHSNPVTGWWLVSWSGWGHCCIMSERDRDIEEEPEAHRRGLSALRHQQHKCSINLAPSTKYFVFTSAAHVHTQTLASVTGERDLPQGKKSHRLTET